MVATRRGTRVDPSEEREGEEPRGQPAMDITTPASQVKTRSRVKRESQSEDAGGNDVDVESTINVTANPSESLKLGAQVVTRRRRKSGQSDGDVSEADSTTSSHSTRTSRSRQAGSSLTDSARKLRSHRSLLVSEPIPESKEDGDISEAESNCSSASSRVKKRQSATILSLITRSSRSVLAPESVINIKEDTEVSEAESNCSSVSGIRSVRRSRNKSGIRIPKCPSPPVVESLADEISDAESCSSGISARPIARRLSMRNKYKSLQVNEPSNEAKSEAAQKLETPIKHEMVCGARVSELMCSENRLSETTLSSPRRSVRIGQNNVTLMPVTEPPVEEHTIEMPNKTSDEEDREKSTCRNLSESFVESPSTKISLKSEDAIDQSGNSENMVIDVELHSSESSDTRKETALILSTDNSREIPKETENDLGEDKCNEVPHAKISLLLDSDDSDQTEESDEEFEEEEVECNKAFGDNGKESMESHQLSEELLGDGLFVIDTKPGIDSSERYYLDSKEDDAEVEDKKEEDGEPCKSSDDDFIDEDADDDDDALLNKPKTGFSLSTSIDTGLKMKDLGGLYINFDASKPNPGPSVLQKMKQGHKKNDELLKNSVITPDFEKKDCVPSNRMHSRKLKELRRQDREKTTGQGWFDMKAPELTDELKNDLKALKMRSAMDPKRFYKKNDRDGFPKYFQVGTVVDNPIDFYHSRIPKKERKRTIVEELLADAEFRRYNKKKYQEIIAEKTAQAEGKKKRKKKKFRN
ncbi:deoxynucleotidyltransferase terminal-interacting protein 2 [Spea bombifrons]|uniref:deoxynucleotidyltransferase terminal-interacting protein 2 n=1 Tax=Spea bombifrons TaxID=233779 RepID=UPI00234B4201|nr:deoxynucleotidyltransferase terminal-interacting protein 2 [Spea bombifrons]